ncbi:MAG: hypothetical protein E3J23_03185 [Candidatus Stahlbacteria bacterium]|nr:MAG: hypothetical protein E3J23_03185 [Candidatus Stahlbacteria bacterium]
MIDLLELKDTLDVDATFRLNEPLEYTGTLENADNALERIKLVLTQTFDALDIPPFKQFIIFGDDKTILIIHYKEEIIGVVFPNKIDLEDVKNHIYERSEVVKKKEKIAVIEEEISEEESKEELAVETEEEISEEAITAEEEVIPQEVTTENEDEITEESKVITVEKEILDTSVIEKISDIAHQYLGDFSLDIVSNVIEDSDLDKENPSMDQVLEVTNSLKNAASLIIGPTKSSELEKDILKVIEDVG